MCIERLHAWGGFLMHTAHQGDAVGHALQRVEDGRVEQLFRGNVQELQGKEGPGLTLDSAWFSRMYSWIG